MLDAVCWLQYVNVSYVLSYVNVDICVCVSRDSHGVCDHMGRTEAAL